MILWHKPLTVKMGISRYRGKEEERSGVAEWKPCYQQIHMVMAALFPPVERGRCIIPVASAVFMSPILSISPYFISIIKAFLNRTVAVVAFCRRRCSRGIFVDAYLIFQQDESDDC